MSVKPYWSDSDLNTKDCNSKHCSYCGLPARLWAGNNDILIAREDRIDCIDLQGHDCTYHKKCWWKAVKQEE